MHVIIPILTLFETFFQTLQPAGGKINNIQVNRNGRLPEFLSFAILKSFGLVVI
jgi:hypothetical protein